MTPGPARLAFECLLFLDCYGGLLSLGLSVLQAIASYRAFPPASNRESTPNHFHAGFEAQKERKTTLPSLTRCLTTAL